MKMKALLLVLLLSAPVAAQSYAFLEGVPGVAVKVEGMQPDALKAGLTVAKLEEATRLRLGLLGVPVLDDEAQVPAFYVNVDVKRIGQSYAVAVQCQLIERVFLNRGERESFEAAATWDYLGLFQFDDLRDAKPVVARCTNEFAELFAKANPGARGVRRN